MQPNRLCTTAINSNAPLIAVESDHIGDQRGKHGDQEDQRWWQERSKQPENPTTEGK